MDNTNLHDDEAIRFRQFGFLDMSLLPTVEGWLYLSGIATGWLHEMYQAKLAYRDQHCDEYVRVALRALEPDLYSHDLEKALGDLLLDRIRKNVIELRDAWTRILRSGWRNEMIDVYNELVGMYADADEEYIAVGNACHNLMDDMRVVARLLQPAGSVYDLGMSVSICLYGCQHAVSTDVHPKLVPYVKHLAAEGRKCGLPRKAAEELIDTITRSPAGEYPPAKAVDLIRQTHARIRSQLGHKVNPGSKPAWERLELKPAGPHGTDQAILDGETIMLRGGSDLAFLKTLKGLAGGAISATKLAEDLRERPDRIYEHLDPRLQAIVSKPGRGSPFGYRML